MANETDRVCGMTVKTSATAPRAEYGGHTYWFCGRGCRKAFELAPEKYLDPGYRRSIVRVVAAWLGGILAERGDRPALRRSRSERSEATGSIPKEKRTS